MQSLLLLLIFLKSSLTTGFKLLGVSLEIINNWNKLIEMIKKTKFSRTVERPNAPVTVPSDYPWVVLAEAQSSLKSYLDPVRSQTLTRIIRARDFAAYTDWSDGSTAFCLGRDGIDRVDVVRADRLLASLVKKFRFDNSSAALRETALSKFLEADDQCSRFNRSRARTMYNCDGSLAPVFQRAKEVLNKILGQVIASDLCTSEHCRHGPGSSVGIPSRDRCMYFKYSQWPYRITSGSAGHARRLISADPRWMGALEDSYRERFEIPKHSILRWDAFWDTVFTVSDVNKVTTVPKDSRTDRPIAIENSLNVMLQLGVDQYIRSALKRWGIDLDSQLLNQELARLGSMDSDIYSTIDLASASDTVSLRVCKTLLPDDWYRYLCDIRSSSGVLPNGELHRYSKMSSMGNGTTFAIEALLFFSIAYGCAVEYFGYYPRDHIAVFGDDLVVPREISVSLCHHLSLAGFWVNWNKSFLSGPFKESCGCDWFHGQYVRPVYVKSSPRFESEIYRDRNRLRRWFSLFFPELELERLDVMYLGWLGRKPLLGPDSDEEFDTYWHSSTPIPNSFRGSAFHFKSLTCSYSDRTDADGFLFRKLMHSLRPLPARQWAQDLLDLTGGASSRFKVFNPTRVKYSRCRRVTPVWRNSYSLVLPPSKNIGRP